MAVGLDFYSAGEVEWLSVLRPTVYNKVWRCWFGTSAAKKLYAGGICPEFFCIVPGAGESRAAGDAAAKILFVCRIRVFAWEAGFLEDIGNMFRQRSVRAMG